MRGLGLGLDLPWGAPHGFLREPDRLAPRTARFLQRHGPRFDAMFCSWQPRSRARLQPAHYAPAWDDLWGRVPPAVARALHHTALNLASPEPYDRGPLLAFTEALVQRHGLRWVNEDLGLWSLGGKALPYPLPPYLTEQSVATCVRNVVEVQRALSVPLRLEFPGFGEGSCPPIGPLDAYDLFRRVIEDSGVDCTLDVAHLLSWRWTRGHRGQALYDELERLPLGACVELHLSGCSIVADQLYDAHHGVLLPEQLELMDRLLALCPRLQLVTFEDPRFDEQGELLPKCAASLAEVERRLADWRRAPGPPEPAPRALPALPAEAGPLPEHEALLRALREPDRLEPLLQGAPQPQLAAASRAWQRHAARRRYAGAGSLREMFPETWKAAAEPGEDALLARFVSSEPYARLREIEAAGPGLCLEEAFYRFCAQQGLGDPQVRLHEYLLAAARALAVDPEPVFSLPGGFRAVDGGYLALLPGDPPTVYAARGGQLVVGRLTGAAAASP
jgi:uncharacterized protein (UPF0276 family)